MDGVSPVHFFLAKMSTLKMSDFVLFARLPLVCVFDFRSSLVAVLKAGLLPRWGLESQGGFCRHSNALTLGTLSFNL